MKTSIDTKWWLVLATLLIIAPSTFASNVRNSRGCDQRISASKCQQVAEGGPAAVYVLGMGITCLGAMFIRSRMSKPIAQNSQ